MKLIQAICIPIMLVLVSIAGCGVGVNGAPKSLDRSTIANSTSNACRDVKIIHFPTQTVFEISRIFAGQTVEIDLSPEDLVAEKAIVSWTVGNRRYRNNIFLPRTVAHSPTALAYRLLPGGRAAVRIAAPSERNATQLARGAKRTKVKKYSMAEHTTVDDVLKFAIGEEEAAVQYYKRLAARMETPAMRDVILKFAAEEQKHKDKLLAVRAGELAIGSGGEEITDLKLPDYMPGAWPTSDMQYKDALIVAMKKEQAAHKLYTRLAALADSAELKSLFLALALEEAKHRVYIETQVRSRLRQEQRLKTESKPK